MSRAGKEPAQDVKRRIVAAVEEAGLTVESASCRLHPQLDVRFIHVYASDPEWPYKRGYLSVMAIVQPNGNWTETVEMRCSASEKEAGLIYGPHLHGRSDVPIASLVEAVQKTVEERQCVQAGIKAGIDGPFKFTHTSWIAF